ncbi:diacylglycerol/lipid kinase family protein [Deinococcus hopiensis]|uniref:Diacylglycerol kinase family enzyme n=1 Tax=Deinococcus hopiensis KR-140 TaxID=695939 RepID=A0A1W1UFC2_9DEIO|nr:diacylglycerol kinase family protein [Deinococcus hopiensis]SMB79786.1 Diacylglycerol kinase family enzyme [Deinococcus hopiensis KR-140]
MNQETRGAVLIFNPGAGGRRGVTPEALVGALAESGFRAEYRPTACEEDLDRVLEGVTGPVFVAGGDGTLRGVALRLLGRPGAQLAPLPMGTSNNVAATLDLTDRTLDLAHAYRDASTRPLDVGRVTAPWGDDVFLEACGCGAFAELLCAYRPDEPKSPLRAVGALVSTLTSFEPLPLALAVDGEAHPGEPATVLEVMNIRATGNGLRLATNADPGDGLLDVVRVDALNLAEWVASLAALARDEFETLPTVQTLNARQVEISYTGQVFHVDGEVRPAMPGVTGQVRIEVQPGALTLLLPRESVQ